MEIGIADGIGHLCTHPKNTYSGQLKMFGTINASEDSEGEYWRQRVYTVLPHFLHALSYKSPSVISRSFIK